MQINFSDGVTLEGTPDQVHIVISKDDFKAIRFALASVAYMDASAGNADGAQKALDLVQRLDAGKISE
jgi:hypothetical protein